MKFPGKGNLPQAALLGLGAGHKLLGTWMLFPRRSLLIITQDTLQMPHVKCCCWYANIEKYFIWRSQLWASQKRRKGQWCTTVFFSTNNKDWISCANWHVAKDFKSLRGTQSVPALLSFWSICIRMYTRRHFEIVVTELYTGWICLIQKRRRDQKFFRFWNICIDFTRGVFLFWRSRIWNVPKSETFWVSYQWISEHFKPFCSSYFAIRAVQLAILLSLRAVENDGESGTWTQKITSSIQN